MGTHNMYKCRQCKCPSHRSAEEDARLPALLVPHRRAEEDARLPALQVPHRIAEKDARLLAVLVPQRVRMNTWLPARRLSVLRLCFWRKPAGHTFCLRDVSPTLGNFFPSSSSPGGTHFASTTCFQPLAGGEYTFESAMVDTQNKTRQLSHSSLRGPATTWLALSAPKFPHLALGTTWRYGAQRS
jgi:hypothetical protein